MLTLPTGRCLNANQPINWAHPLNLSLVSRWQAIPAAAGCTGWGGLTWRDLSRRAKDDGALTNGPAWTPASNPGRFAGSLSFDGTNDYVARTAGTSYANTDGHTYAAWVQFTTGGLGWVIGNENGSTTGTAMALSATGQPEFWYQGGNAANVAAGNVTSGVWAHIAVAWNASDTKVRHYINGKLDTTSSAIATTWSALTTGVGKLGVFVTAASFFFKGQMDDVRQWSRTLPDDEIYRVYTDSLCGSPDTLNWLGKRTWFVNSAATGRLARACGLDGLGGAGQQAFNPTLAGV